MLIFADKRLPEEALKNLGHYGKVIRFETRNIVYDSIACHPDIFLCVVNDKIIIAPNLPHKYKQYLVDASINFDVGEENLGQKFPQTAKYNVVCTENFLMHNFRYTDSKITDSQGDLDLIHLNQGYSRCNLLPLQDDHFITSDEGIHRIMQNYKLDSILVDPTDIILPGQKHGFIGGACGVWGNNVFISGSLSHFKDGKKVYDFLNKLNYKIIELYDGPLIDGGSILFI